MASTDPPAGSKPQETDGALAALLISFKNEHFEPNTMVIIDILDKLEAIFSVRTPIKIVIDRYIPLNAPHNITTPQTSFPSSMYQARATGLPIQQHPPDYVATETDRQWLLTSFTELPIYRQCVRPLRLVSTPIEHPYPREGMEVSSAHYEMPHSALEDLMLRVRAMHAGYLRERELRAGGGGGLAGGQAGAASALWRLWD